MPMAAMGPQKSDELGAYECWNVLLVSFVCENF